MIENKIDSDRQDKKAEHDGSLFRFCIFLFSKAFNKILSHFVGFKKWTQNERQSASIGFKN